jgi:amidohydrolase
MVTAFQTVVSRSVNPIDTAVVSVGQFRAGEAPNVLPDRAELRGTIRTYAADVRELVVKRIQEIGQGIAASMGVRFSFELTYSTPATVTDAGVVKLVQGVAREMFGSENVVSDHRTMSSEDMGLILERVPGCYIFLGSNNAERGLDFPHHHPQFDFDEAAMPVGAELLARAAIRCLEA